MKIGNLEVYGIIYKITNIINGKIYIGQTVKGFDKRYNCKGKGIERVYNYHKTVKEKKGYYNEHLCFAIEKYGFENFVVDKIIDVAFSRRELDLKEINWIRIYNSFHKGYNKTPGGNSVSGADNPTAKAVVQLSKKGEYIKTWDCVKDAENSLGILSSKISNCCNGIYGRKSTGGFMWVFLEDYNKNKNFTYKNLCGEYNKISVVKLDKQGNFINRYNSLSEAEQDTPGSNGDKISMCCRGKRKTHKNYIWVFAEEYDESKDYSLKDPKCGRWEVPVIQLSLDGDFIKEHKTIGQALKELNIKTNHISDCCLNKRKTCGGFKWKYSEDYYKNNTQNTLND